MKKILLFIVALVATLSMNAQTTEIYKGTTLQKAYYGADVTVSFGENSITVKQGEVNDSYTGSDYKVVSKELPPPPAGSIGKAKRTGSIDVNWVQLWKDGPKFATYNVGAKDSTEYGGYYAWGGSKDKVDDHNTTNTGSGNLSDDDNTATNLWGSNWRMPTREELAGLLNNCDVQWTANYNGTGKAGRIFTGKGDYASNSIFLPATGYNDDNVIGQGSLGYYWSSTPNGSDNAYFLSFGSGSKNVGYNSRSYGYSVRAVLKELPPSPAGSIGTAKTKNEDDVNWVQLWKDGPKFAECNIGATNATDYGHYLAWGGSTNKDATNNAGSADLSGSDDSAYKVWGEHWRMPTNTDFSTLISNCTCTWKTNYNETGVNGLLCRGKGDYSSNSIFLPVAGLWNKGQGVISKDYKEGWYWSSTKTTKGENARCMHIQNAKSEVIDGSRVCGYFVRPIYVEDLVAVTGVSLKETNLKVGKGNTETLSATVAPANATNKKVLWTSSDETVATVDAYGKVTGVASGTCNIKATTEDGKKTATCAVEVAVITTGSATAKIDGKDVDVKWIQLWKDGPKFATYNVGVTNGKAESYGGYYCWGKATDQDSKRVYKMGESALTGNDDTATKLWGGNWRMPTKEELKALIDSCDVEWMDGSTKKYNNTKVKGLLCKGKEKTDYESNSIFLPAAGYFDKTYDKINGIDFGAYWSSTPFGDASAYRLYFGCSTTGLISHDVNTGGRSYGYSVRAVFAK